MITNVQGWAELKPGAKELHLVWALCTRNTSRKLGWKQSGIKQACWYYSQYLHQLYQITSLSKANIWSFIWKRSDKKEWQTTREREREKRSSIYWFIPQMPTIARTRPSQTKSPDFRLALLHGCPRPRLSSHPLLPMCTKQVAGWKKSSQEPNLNQRSGNGMLTLQQGLNVQCHNRAP